MKAPVRTTLADYRAHLQKVYGPRLAGLILFGSQARGDAARDSDIDVMIILSGPLDQWEEIQRTSRMTAELSLKYDTVISRIFSTPEQAKADTSPFHENIRREGVLV